MDATAGCYAEEQARRELAMRMIGHEARTCTIRACTGLSDDRIRRLYARYFKNADGGNVRRQRGKSPTRTRIYVKNPVNQCETTTLALLFLAFDLVAIDADGRMRRREPDQMLRFGQLFCLAFETYRAVHAAPHLCFERAWSLLRALLDGRELVLLDCALCDGVYVHHVTELDDRRCPCCRLKGVSAPRNGPAIIELAARRRRAALRTQAPAPAPAKVAEPD